MYSSAGYEIGIQNLFLFWAFLWVWCPKTEPIAIFRDCYSDFEPCSSVPNKPVDDIQFTMLNMLECNF